MATQKITRSTLPSQSVPDVDLTIKRVSASLALIAEAVDEMTEVGENDLDGKAAYGFSNVVRSCAEDLEKLTPSSKKVARHE